MATSREQRIITNAARSAGINPAILWGLYGAESNFGHNKNTSTAGAVGPFQFLPSTARGMGVDPYNFKQAAFGAARYLAQYKGRGTRAMIGAYNAGPAGNIHNSETAAYIPKVLQLAKTYKGGGGGAGAGASGSRTASVGALDAQGAAQGSTGTLALLQALTSNEKQAPPITAPAAPAFAAGPTMPQGYQAPQSMSAPQAPKPDVNALLTAIQTQGQGTGVPGNPAASVTQGGQGSSGGTDRHGRGKVTIEGPQPNRIVSPLRNILGTIAGQAGRQLAGPDGSTHSKMTTNGTVSEHYTGHAFDIFKSNGKPVTGAENTRIGRAALVAAGWSPARARKAGPGLYNVEHNGHRIQIIFGTNSAALGGDHTDHVHVGYR